MSETETETDDAGFWDGLRAGFSGAQSVLEVIAQGAENVRDVYGSIADIHTLEDEAGYERRADELTIAAREAAIDRGDSEYARYWPLVVGVVAVAVVVVVMTGRGK